MERKDWFKWKSYIPMLISGGIAIAIFLPWQLYILNVFTEEALYEYELNSRHLTEAIEGHGETLWFHFNLGFKRIYSYIFAMRLVYWLAVGWFIVRIKGGLSKFFVGSILVFVYTFYTIAETKMTAFPIIAMPFFLMAFASLIDDIICLIQKAIKNKRIIFSIQFSGIVIASYPLCWTCAK